ncbi:IS1 family transposase [Nocardia amamiensis]|uniref:IS1 family transposase n=1 Tax=Nocardia amamiensis TaxID=404578 RepID=A0ABS0D4C0_9NOCA|nr:IS1 family transposase [Nocardia amamiensis]MBF6302837.1 IS1 family transposase [Nocardia amamiensis]
MVTVEADPGLVESRLAVGGIWCPACGGGVLAGWGFARVRRVEGLEGTLRPRRARCRDCRVTHVLLPVTVLARRSYAAHQVWAAITARAVGAGHRSIAAALSVPAATVRGWLRRAGARLEALRSRFLQVAVVTGVDVVIPDSLGCGWRDLVAAVEVTAAVVRTRFGSHSVVGAVTALRMVVAVSGGRLLSPGWPTLAHDDSATPVAPDGGTV